MTKKRLFLLAKFAITATLLWLVFRGLDFAYIESRLQSIVFWPMLVAALLILFQSLLIAAWRWNRVLATVDSSPPLTVLMRFLLIGLFFNQALPSTIGGDGVRMWLLHRNGSNAEIAFRSVIVDRFLGLLALLLLALAGAPLILDLFGSDNRGLIAALIIGSGLVGSVGIILLLRQRRWLETRLVRRNLAMIAFDVVEIARDWRRVAAIIVVSLVGHIAICASLSFIARGLQVELSLADSLVITPTTMALLVLPISIAGWGLREGILVFGLGLVGIAAADAAMVSVFFGLMLIVIGLPGGLVWLMTNSSRAAAVQQTELAENVLSAEVLDANARK